MILREYDVKVIAFPPHTTRISQASSPSLFGVLSRKLQYKLPFDNGDLAVALIQKAFRALTQTNVPDNVRNAFTMLEFEFHIATQPHPLLLREEKLRGSQGFREISDGDDPLDRLSKKNPESRYGWINPGEEMSSRVIIYLFSKEISKCLGLNIHFTCGCGLTSARISLVRLEFSILHSFQGVLSLAKSRAPVRVMRYS
jgi:hypothetical protein